MAERVDIGNTVTLFLGDAREVVEEIANLHTIVTDPPYGMSFQSNHRKEKHLKIENDNSCEMLDWVVSLSPCHSSYIFGRWDNLIGIKKKPKSVITWVKNNWSMGDLKHEHARQTEVIFFYPGKHHRWTRGRPRDVLHFNRTKNKMHPTEKPIDLMEEIISLTEGTVVDPFMGSGSTGVAAVRAGRPFIGVEINKEHFDTAVSRIGREFLTA